MKEGILIKSVEGFRHYNHQHLKDLQLPDGTTPRTLKSQKDGAVLVANKYIAVMVYADGRVEMHPHDQVKELIENGENND